MWIRLSYEEVCSVAHYLGRLMLGVALAMLLPLVTALVSLEWDPALDYVVGIGATLLVAVLLMSASREARSISRREALMISGLTCVAS